MKVACLLACLAALMAQSALAQGLDLRLQTLDGIFTTDERNAASDSLHQGETSVWIQYKDPLLRVTVESEPIGVASLCLGTADRVRVLHASAALGMLDYHPTDATWTSEHSFAWALRDTSMTADALEARRGHLDEHGWVATTFGMGLDGVTEFLIRRDLLPAGALYLALGIMPLSRPQDILGAPSDTVGDCARGDLVRGPAPLAGLSFEPESWKRILDR